MEGLTIKVEIQNLANPSLARWRSLTYFAVRFLRYSLTLPGYLIPGDTNVGFTPTLGLLPIFAQILAVTR